MNNEIITFKSDPEFYYKEESGAKNNTVRKLPIGDDREKLLRIMASLVDYGCIRIQNTVTKESFTRRIRDVSIWEGLMIITWETRGLI